MISDGHSPSRLYQRRKLGFSFVLGQRREPGPLVPEPRPATGRHLRSARARGPDDRRPGTDAGDESGDAGCAGRAHIQSPSCLRTAQRPGSATCHQVGRDLASSVLARSVQAELAADQRAQGIRDLRMPGYRCVPHFGRIAVDIVAFAVPMEEASGRRQLARERLPLHTSSSTGRRWAVVGAGGRSSVTISS